MRENLALFLKMGIGRLKLRVLKNQRMYEQTRFATTYIL